ncbi:hypothetical protein SFR_4490 [Streptomyces sp. FR-008]|nr:hypothetical protein SFR_4490 [Streptomyces sp. FR-008]
MLRVRHASPLNPPRQSHHCPSRGEQTAPGGWGHCAGHTPHRARRAGLQRDHPPPDMTTHHGQVGRYGRGGASATWQHDAPASTTAQGRPVDPTNLAHALTALLRTADLRRIHFYNVAPGSRPCSWNRAPASSPTSDASTKQGPLRTTARRGFSWRSQGHPKTARA